jgi:hypothetical protein
MRLWTLHPRYLDSQGLVAVWREALLARAVIARETRGYTRHPQLIRFLETQSPLDNVNRYLNGVYKEAARRGFEFDAAKLSDTPRGRRLPETSGQLEYEWAHLLAKLRVRAPVKFEELAGEGTPQPHPLFRIVPGPLRPWEKVRAKIPV